MDDADDFIDIDCKANTASSDPNDKQAFPLGYGSQHFIEPLTPIEYQIRFQNTGNDTAFTVQVIDTLSAWLDPATIRAGASSHPYIFDLDGTGVAHFLFDNIMLPDSNINEPASHGFVKFTITPRATAPLGTYIYNKGEIYFDYNDAVVTNTTYHRIGHNFIALGLWQPVVPEAAVDIAPNPFSRETVLTIKGKHYDQLQLQVYDFTGKEVLEMESASNIFKIKSFNAPAGNYFFTIRQSGQIIGNGKLIAQ